MAFSREFRARLGDLGFTFGEFIHLERLWEQDGLNQKELSRRVGIASASSTQIIEALERRGLITREKNPNDRRNIHVFLTEQGRAKDTELLACAREINRIAREGLSTDAILTLFDTVQRIIDNIEAASPSDARKQSFED